MSDKFQILKDMAREYNPDDMSLEEYAVKLANDYSNVCKSNYKLQQENQQLKEELNKYKRIYRENPTLYDEIAPYIINECNLENKLKQYKSVLDEIREYIKEHNDYLEKAKEIYIGCNDELLKPTCIQLINNELVRSDNLLQILDKVKGVNK